MKKYFIINLLLFSTLSANADENKLFVFKNIFKSNSRLIDSSSALKDMEQLSSMGCVVEFDERREERISITVEETGDKFILKIKEKILEKDSRYTYLCENSITQEECVVLENKNYVILLFRQSRVLYLLSDRSFL